MVICVCVCIHVFVHGCEHVHDGLTLAEQLLALSVTPEAMKSYFMTAYLGPGGGVGVGGLVVVCCSQ